MEINDNDNDNDNDNLTHPLFRLMIQSINMIPQQGIPDDILQQTFEGQQPKENPCCN